ncbi:hypothetical protein E8A74_11865 [Polyangium fumosum]|uniref:Uncharacterized protein n=1 Tax=Polyangium fumosum TaxID=889272 RepID=A0A4U1JGH3_9BACT|nr:hypothetical protein E8A74_11865 [Polyangium fumosum]
MQPNEPAPAPAEPPPAPPIPPAPDVAPAAPPPDDALDPASPHADAITRPITPRRAAQVEEEERCSMDRDYSIRRPDDRWQHARSRDQGARKVTRTNRGK